MSKKNKGYIQRFLCLSMLAIVITACSVQQYIPEDQLLYTGSTITLKDTDSTKAVKKAELKQTLQKVIQPKPNSTFLGSYVGLYYYYKNQKENTGFINRFLYKQLGQEPVYLSDISIPNTEDLLHNRMENNGYFYSAVSGSTTENEAQKKGSINFTVTVPSPYRLATYQLDSVDPVVGPEIRNTLGESLYNEGDLFDLDKLKQERDRISTALKRIGFYNFNPDFILFQTDTNQYDNKRFDLFLTLKKEVPKAAKVPYRVRNVNIYPNYDLSTDSIYSDSTRYDDKTYYQDSLFFKPKRLDPFVTIRPGERYDPLASKNTSRRLSSIGTYRYVDINYVVVDSIQGDSVGILDANLYLSPLNKRSIRAEVQAVTKSNSFAGPGVGVTYTNRNLFKGGESLDLSFLTSYEVQIGGDNGNVAGGTSSLELELNSELTFPRMLVPFSINEDFFEYSIPRTITGISLNYLNRSKLYTLLSGTAQFGYQWDANRLVRHQLNPISINYTRLSNTTPEFDEILANNPFLERSFEQQLISGLTYSFTYNELIDPQQTHQIYLNGTVDLAGNSLSIFDKAQANSASNTIFGLEYAQFAKFDADFRYHFRLGKNRRIATRLFGGYGLAYGNSEVVPFIKQYFSGGPYSVRAFQIRSLGPGTYDSATNENSTFFDQIGNIRLEANIEYRFPLFNYVNGAFFVDAGNIWNSKENVDFPGGRFTSNFINEFGIGGGFGVRVDIQGFVIRFDLAAPFHDPALPEQERWDFKFDEPILNFAIGYPF